MGGERTRLLVVTDDPETAGRYAEWTPPEWAVGTARDGRAALRALDQSVDLVVVSLSLPDRPGETVLREIHNRGYECQLIAVADRSRPTPEVADDLLVAPVDPSTYRQRLRAASERVTYDRRLREYFELVSEMADLEERTSPAELAESEEYARLTERARHLRERVDELIQDADDDEYDQVFREFFPGTAPA